MSGTLARKISGSREGRIGADQPRVAAINALETDLAALSDDALLARTEVFKKAIATEKSGDDSRRNDR